MKENLVKVLKNNGKKIVVIIVLIVFIFALITGALRYLKNELGKSNDSDPKNGPSAAKKFIQATTIDDDGNITFSQTISEYWEELKKNNNKLTELLSSPEELAKLINAQVATEYLDTRENPDDPIDWDAINKDVDSTSVQGIIKLKRALEDGTTITMTYVSPKEFQSYIDEYNKSGSEKAKENALKHFTIEKTGSSASGSAGILTGSGNFTKYTDLTDAQIKALAVVCYHEQGSLKGAAAEASLMANLFEIKGSSYSSVYDYVKNSGWFALNEYNMDTENIGDDYINVVRAVLVEGKRTIPGYIDEHDYVGDIISVTNNGETINKSDKSKYIQHVTKIKTVYGATYTFYSYPAENSDPFGYTSEERRQKIGDAYYDFDTGVLMNGSNTSNVADSNTQNNSSVETVNNVNESTNSGILTWPLPGYTDLSSEYGYRNCPYHGYEFHDGIDIPAPSGTEVLAADGGVVTTAEYHSSFGNYVIIDHGNGYKTQYNHNSKLNVSKGQTVSKGQVISYVGTTGTSTGNHLDFRILNSKNESMNPMDFKYDNGVGNGSKSYSNSEIQGNDNNTSSSSTSQYVAKVATWSENQKITETNDSSVEINDYHNYNMSTQTIPYHDFVSKYEMPFSYLWILLIYSEDKDFVFDLADLVYGSEFEITIHDNYTKTTNVVKNLYQKKTRYVTDAVNVKVTYSDYIDPQYSTSGGSNIPDEGEETLKETTVNVPGQKGEKTKIAPSSSEFYHVIETTINKNNTLDISLTKANAWCADYEQEYTYGHTDEELVGENKTNLADTEEITDEQFYDNDPGGVAEEIRQRVLSEYSGHTTCVAKVTSSRTLCYYSTIGRVRYTEDYLETSNYVSSPGKIKEKTDKNATEPNFVTILCENYNARSNILSCELWLFGTLEDNDDTKDLVDLTKYLLQKVVDKDGLYIKDDFETIWSNRMNSYSDISGGVSGIDGIPGQIYDFLLSKGVPAVGAAAIMGNIEGESSFDPTVVNEIGASGLCQWYDRFPKLKAYAESKKTEWTDVQTQLEFMWIELNGDYSEVKDVIMSTTSESDMEYATWYWGRYYEVFFIGDSYEATKHNTSQRYEYAKKWYKEWQEKHISAGGSGVASAASSPDVAKYNFDITNGYIEFKQYAYDNTPYWGGTIKENGCMPTSLAIIMSGLGVRDKNGNAYTPETLISPEYGSLIQAPSRSEQAQSSLRRIGVNISNVKTTKGNENDILTNLRLGRPLLVHATGPSELTSRLHFMALICAKSTGDMVYLSNPSRSTSKNGISNGWMSLNKLISIGMDEYRVVTYNR